MRFITFGALYFAQGVPWGFIAVGFVVFLTDLGLDNTAVGSALGLAYLPWSFKVVFGPIIDRFPSRRWGRRRPFIIAAELGMGLSMLALLFVSPAEQLGLLSGVLFIHNVFAAMQDVAVDALAVDVLQADERGRANSVMWACKSAGVAAGGGGGTVIAKYLGWNGLFVLIAIIIVAIMVLVLFVRERAVAADEAAPTDDLKLSWTELKRSFNFATPLLGLAASMVTVVGTALTIAVFTRTIRADLEFSAETIGALSGVLEPISGVVGALIGGVVADRVGVRRAMGGFMALCAVALLAFSFMLRSSPSPTEVAMFTAVHHGSFYAFNAAALGFYMTMSNPAIGATHFAIFMAGTNLTYAWASPAGGMIADRWGVSTTYLVAAGLQLAAIVILPFCDPSVAERRFRGET